MERFLDQQKAHLVKQSYRLQLHSPAKKLEQQKATFLQLEQKLLDAMDKKLLNQKHKLALAAEKLDTVSPLATLKRGYSITQDDTGKVITQASQTKTGDVIVTRLSDGTVRSTVN